MIHLPIPVKNFLKGPFIQSVLSFVAASWIRFVFYTNRWKWIGYENIEQQQGKPFIACFWHNRLMMLSFAWKNTSPLYMMVSTHRDGHIIRKTVERLGIFCFHGSSSKQGFSAARAALKHLKQGHCIGITPDGPRGPRETLTAGVVELAQLAKVDILPVTFSCSKQKILNTWDLMRLVKPFGKGVFVWGNAINADRKKNINQIMSEIECEMTRIDKIANDAIKD